MDTTVTDSIPTIKTLDEGTRCHNNVKDDKGLGETFHEAGRGLSLVTQALQEVQGNSNRANQSVTNLLRACNIKANVSASIFKSVSQAPESSRVQAYEAAVRQEGDGQMVEVWVIGMMNDACALAKSCAIPAQVQILHEAIGKLSKMEPSLSTKGSGHAFNSYGGEQNNIVNGVQNINKDGNQITGSHFHGSVSFGAPATKSGRV